MATHRRHMAWETSTLGEQHELRSRAETSASMRTIGGIPERVQNKLRKMLRESNFEEFMELIDDFKVDIDFVDHQQETPLHHACKSGDPMAVEMCLLRQANVNHPNKKGRTPLMKASSAGLSQR